MAFRLPGVACATVKLPVPAFAVTVPETGTKSLVAIVTLCVPPSRRPVFIEIGALPSLAKLVTSLTVLTVDSV